MRATQFIREVVGAIEALRSGGALCLQFSSGSAATYWLEPDGRSVSRDVALWVLQDPRIKAARDGLFPGFAQTWGYVDDEVGIFSRMAKANQEAPESAGVAPTASGPPL